MLCCCFRVFFSKFPFGCFLSSTGFYMLDFEDCPLNFQVTPVIDLRKSLTSHLWWGSFKHQSSILNSWHDFVTSNFSNFLNFILCWLCVEFDVLWSSIFTDSCSLGFILTVVQPRCRKAISFQRKLFWVMNRQLELTKRKEPYASVNPSQVDGSCR